MDCIKAVQAYINKMTSEVSGMKVLLLDKETMAIISIVYTQSQLLAKEIYLIDRIESKREKQRHLKCICFLRPNPQSIQFLTQELREPCFGEYYLYFSNVLQKSSIERLAECDSHEVVKEVQEYFADFVSMNQDLFSLNVTVPDYSLFVESSKAWNPMTLTRVTEGITGLLLGLKKKPLIRFEANSALARKLSAEISYSIQNEGPLYDFKRTDTPPILLILDRRNDPVTPLLNQWTYQAMIHELFGITNGRVELVNAKDVRPENKDIVLSIEQDSFFKENMHANLGDLGTTIKNYVDEFQLKHNSTKTIESIADMKRFVEDYPEFKKLSGNVSKHVTLVGELSRKVAQGKLLEMGELEQSLAVSDSHTNDAKMLEQVLVDTSLDNEYKTRLVMLYALRYEKLANNKIPQFIELLKRCGAGDLVSLVNAVITYAGSEVRLEPTSSVEDFIGRTKNGVENVYTQHTPRIVRIVQECIKGKLKDQHYPFFEEIQDSVTSWTNNGKDQISVNKDVQRSNKVL